MLLIADRLVILLSIILDITHLFSIPSNKLIGRMLVPGNLINSVGSVVVPEQGKITNFINQDRTKLGSVDRVVIAYKISQNVPGYNNCSQKRFLNDRTET